MRHLLRNRQRFPIVPDAVLRQSGRRDTANILTIVLANRMGLGHLAQGEALPDLRERSDERFDIGVAV